jgi:flagellar biosynthesis protein
MSGPLKKAVALRYDPAQESAPTLIAKGQGYVAERIIALAKEHDIHVQQDPALVELLLTLDLSQQIPPTLFKAVAQVLGTVYRVNRELARARGIR